MYLCGTSHRMIQLSAFNRIGSVILITSIYFVNKDAPPRCPLLNINHRCSSSTRAPTRCLEVCSITNAPLTWPYKRQTMMFIFQIILQCIHLRFMHWCTTLIFILLWITMVHILNQTSLTGY
jgi:hypothetical protein